MGIEDMMGQAKDLLAGHEDQVDAAVDKAAEVAKEQAPDQADAVIDAAAQKAKDAL